MACLFKLKSDHIGPVFVCHGYMLMWIFFLYYSEKFYFSLFISYCERLLKICRMIVDVSVSSL